MRSIQKTLAQSKVVIMVDNREMQSDVVRHLRFWDPVITSKNLQIGDYILSDRVVAERKTIQDFISSITDQRLFSQLEMIKAYESPLLILEGNPELLFLESNMNPNSLRGVMASIAVDYKIPIIWTSNSKETAAQLHWIAYREQIKLKKSVHIRSIKRVVSIRDQQEFLVAGLPGISSTLSRKLLVHFKSPKRLFTASEEKLKKVDKIGEFKARMIRKILDSVYTGRTEKN